MSRASDANNRYKIRYTRTQDRPASRQVNDHGRVSGTHRVSDITYIRTGEGWLYLAVVLDLGSRRLLGYQMSDRIDARLAQDALNMAGAARGGRTAGIVFHSDRGSNYQAKAFKNSVRSWGMNQSVGRVGSCLLTGQLGLGLAA